MKEKLENASRMASIIQKRREEIFTKEYLNSFKMFMFFGIGCEEVLDEEKLFKVFDDELNIPNIFAEKIEIKDAENKRHGNTSLNKVYYFNDPEGFSKPIRVDLVIQNLTIPSELNRKFPKITIRKYVDVEFFEYYPLEVDSKNSQLKEILEEYLVEPDTTIELIEEIDSVLALQDVEKLHMAFIVDDKENIYLVYLGVGTNQPFNYGLKEMCSYGKNRYYRFSVNTAQSFEQKSYVKKSKIDLPEDWMLFTDYVSDGTKYALCSQVGVVVFDKNHWLKADYGVSVSDLDPNIIFRYDGLKFVERKLDSLFPDFEHYLQVKFDPFEYVQKLGHKKAVKYLRSKKLLGQGFESKMNVASDFYLNGYDDMCRLKPTMLLFKYMLSNNYLKEELLK